MDNFEARVQELEKKVKSLQRINKSLRKIQKDLKAREKAIQRLQDIEDIQRLQCAYGYYLEHWMGKEILELFSKREDVEATFVEGTYYGQEGIKKYFGKARSMPPEFLHLVMQISPVITVAEDGLTAKGRWYGLGFISVVVSQGVKPMMMVVTYEMDYIKEEGVWKIWKLALQMHFAYPAGKSWVSPDKLAPENAPIDHIKLNPDKWADYEIGYPSGYIFPMHFKHPVTGQPSSEAEYNARLNLKPNIYRNM